MAVILREPSVALVKLVKTRGLVGMGDFLVNG